MAATRERITPESRNLVKMSWDPITRIVGNLGIYTKIDFDDRKVVECKSTSSIFRGYSVFMKGKDPRDAGFITSRICGICGDNHAVCANYAQNMAFGVTNPPLAEIIINLGEAAEYMFDHTIFQDNLVFVDFCEQMVKETSLVDINLGIRILLGSSYYEDWANEETFVQRDPLGNEVDKRHPWNQTTIPAPQKRDLDGGNYSWVMSPRWLDQRTGDHLALDTGGGPLARLWATALAGLVDTPYVKSTGSSVQINPPRPAQPPEMTFQWKIPQYGSNTIERDRARAYFIAYAAGIALFAVERALGEIRKGQTRVFENFEVPDEAIGCGFHEAVRGVLSHHLVIRDKKIANYHPYPPTPWNASPRDFYGTPGPYEDAVQGQKIFEENDQENFRGIDIMRTVRSFDPCLPCGVHMYLGDGKVLEQRHSPTLGVGVERPENG